MPVARWAILDGHAVAKETDEPVDIALLHAVGQACGVVNAPGHALGFPIYELSAVVFGDLDDFQDEVERRVDHYLGRLAYWHDNVDTRTGSWAAFMEH